MRRMDASMFNKCLQVLFVPSFNYSIFPFKWDKYCWIPAGSCEAQPYQPIIRAWFDLQKQKMFYSLGFSPGSWKSQEDRGFHGKFWTLGQIHWVKTYVETHKSNEITLNIACICAYWVEIWEIYNFYWAGDFRLQTGNLLLHLLYLAGAIKS